MLAAFEELSSALTSVADERTTEIGAVLAEVQAFGRSSNPEAAYHQLDLGHLAMLAAEVIPEVVQEAAAMVAAVEVAVVYRVDGKKTRDAYGVSAYFPPAPENYEDGFDLVDGFDTWRTLQKAFYTAASDQAAPGFVGGVNGGVLDDSVPTGGECGDGVCEPLALETPFNCAEDCVDGEFIVPACEGLPVDPASSPKAPTTLPQCVANFRHTCALVGGQWLSQILYCPSIDKVCATKAGAPEVGACVLPPGGSSTQCDAGGALVRQISDTTPVFVETRNWRASCPSHEVRTQFCSK